MAGADEGTIAVMNEAAKPKPKAEPMRVRKLVKSLLGWTGHRYGSCPRRKRVNSRTVFRNVAWRLQCNQRIELAVVPARRNSLKFGLVERSGDVGLEFLGEAPAVFLSDRRRDL
jgi:hypothetical protein